MKAAPLRLVTSADPLVQCEIRHSCHDTSHGASLFSWSKSHFTTAQIPTQGSSAERCTPGEHALLSSGEVTLERLDVGVDAGEVCPYVFLPLGLFIAHLYPLKKAAVKSATG